MKICLAHNYIFLKKKKTFYNLMNGETWTEILNRFFMVKCFVSFCRFMIAILFENITYVKGNTAFLMLCNAYVIHYVGIGEWNWIYEC